MRKWRLSRYVHLLLLAVAIAVCGGTGTAFAITSSSSHYQLTETQFSSGANGESCSATYCAQASLGDTSTPRASSAAFGTQASTVPEMSVIVDAGESDLGVLTTEKTSTKTMVVKVKSILSGGYVLQIVGDTPKFNGHNLTALSTPTAATPGVEQFGLNVVANTSPNVGTAPAQTPADQAIYGAAADNYKISNKFMYVSGDVIGKSSTESGQTDYTVSMIVNIASSTPAGHYSGDFSAIVIPIY
jgi:hypothetical protein